jgi:hypothetical protein
MIVIKKDLVSYILKYCTIVALIVQFSSSILQASSLDTFKDNSKKQSRKRERRSPSRSYNTGTHSELAEVIGELLFDIVIALAHYTMTTSYRLYPYGPHTSGQEVQTVSSRDEAEPSARSGLTEDNSLSDTVKSEERTVVELYTYKNQNTGSVQVTETEDFERNSPTSHNDSDSESVVEDRLVAERNQDIDTPFVYVSDDKKWMYQMSGYYQYIPDGTRTVAAELHGKFLPLIGPEVSYKQYCDNDDTLYHYRFGLNYTLIQHGGFLLDIYGQAAGMSGMMDTAGLASGVRISLYPFSPLTAHTRFGYEIYETITYSDFEIRLGYQYEMFEFFAGYESFGKKNAKLDGVLCGITVTF